MKRLNVLFVSVFGAMFVFGCSQFSSSPTASSQGSKGEVQLLVNLGKVGALAKSAAITLDSLTLDFTATGENPIHKMIPIFGPNDQTVNFTVSLGVNKDWTVIARTYDGVQTWNNVHYGSTSFKVIEGINPIVILNLSARYSMLMVRINPVPDSSTSMILGSGNDMNMIRMTKWDDITYAKGFKSSTDTVKLYYDWLQVTDSTMRNSENIQVLISGTWDGKDSVPLYWGTLKMDSVFAGQDANRFFNLNWCGPAPSKDSVQTRVVLGKIGLQTVYGTPKNQ